jgi:hypothetical protein
MQVSAVAVALLVFVVPYLADATGTVHDRLQRRSLGYRDHIALTPLQQGVLLLVLSGRANHVSAISTRLGKPNRASVMQTSQRTPAWPDRGCRAR